MAIVSQVPIRTTGKHCRRGDGGLIVTWTIRNKLWAIGVIASISLAILGGIAWTSSLVVASAVENSASINSRVALVNEMSRANLELILNAMDSIVDKDEGVIIPERASAIDDGVKDLRRLGANLLGTEGDPVYREFIGKINTTIDPLAKGIQIDLKRLIETRAPTDDFAAIDDVIDTYGETMSEYLATYEQRLLQDFASSVERTGNAVIGAEVWSTVAFVLSFLILSATLFLLGRSITRPLAAISGSMTRLARGDLSIEIVGSDRKDEIGEMASALVGFKDSLAENERLQQAQRSEQVAKTERAARIEKMLAEFEADADALLENVKASAGRMVASARITGDQTNRSGSRSFEVAEAAERTTELVESIADATRELASSINEISMEASNSTSTAQDAVTRVGEATGQIKALDTESQRIGEVIGLISDIAEQTNLLALNATIEAARAGDAGKGFAVVASEVKNLASQTARATEEISRMIDSIQGATSRSVETIDRLGEVIASISERTAGIAAAVEEQNATTQNITQSTDQVSSEANFVLDSVGQLAQGASRSASKSVAMLWEGESLGQILADFDRNVREFLQSVKQA